MLTTAGTPSLTRADRLVCAACLIAIALGIAYMWYLQVKCQCGCLAP